MPRGSARPGRAGARGDRRASGHDPDAGAVVPRLAGGRGPPARPAPEAGPVAVLEGVGARGVERGARRGGRCRVAAPGGRGSLPGHRDRRAGRDGRRARVRAGGAGGRGAHAPAGDRPAGSPRVPHPRSVPLLRRGRRARHVGARRGARRSGSTTYVRASPTAGSQPGSRRRARPRRPARRCDRVPRAVAGRCRRRRRPRELLTRLGVRTLGAFAALPPASVLARSVPTARRAPARARGGGAPAALTEPPPDLVEECELDPPARARRRGRVRGQGLADRLLARLAARGLACTQVVVEAETEHGEHLARAWRHEGALTPATLAERVRWQLDGWLTGGRQATRPGSRCCGSSPTRCIPATGRQLGFWGGDAAAADRAGAGARPVQGLLGPEHGRDRGARRAGARRPSGCGGCRGASPASPSRSRARSIPAWPGAVPGPGPGRVLDPPVARPCCSTSTVAAVTVTSRGDASGVTRGAAVRRAAGPRRGGHRVGGPVGAGRALVGPRAARPAGALAGRGRRRRLPGPRLSAHHDIDALYD